MVVQADTAEPSPPVKRQKATSAEEQRDSMTPGQHGGAGEHGQAGPATPSIVRSSLSPLLLHLLCGLLAQTCCFLSINPFLSKSPMHKFHLYFHHSFCVLHICISCCSHVNCSCIPFSPHTFHLTINSCLQVSQLFESCVAGLFDSSCRAF